MSDEKAYLGDSVYVEYDGHNLILTTKNDDTGPSDLICLEPAVYVALTRFVNNLKNKKGEDGNDGSKRTA